MPSGTLDVHLVSAKGLEDQNWLSAGTKPRWNENFLFTITGDVEEITLRIMDKDTLSSDEFVGEAIIPLAEVLRQGEVAERAYNVVRKGKFHGEIKVSLTFTSESGSHGRSDEGEYGGHNNYGESDEDEPRGRRNSRGDSVEEEYGGRGNSRNNSRGDDDDDDDDYGSRRRSGGSRRRNDEDY